MDEIQKFAYNSLFKKYKGIFKWTTIENITFNSLFKIKYLLMDNKIYTVYNYTFFI